jgi:hypothetical protein
MGMTAKQRTLLDGAVKSAVAAVTGIIIGNCVDLQNPILSWPWLRHLMITAGFTLLITEARFWNQWATSGNGHEYKVLPAADDNDTADSITVISPNPKDKVQGGNKT